MIRAFEYLSTFGYCRQALRPALNESELRQASERFISQTCIRLIEINTSAYMAQKMLNMAAKCATYHV